MGGGRGEQWESGQFVRSRTPSLFHQDDRCGTPTIVFVSLCQPRISQDEVGADASISRP